jgi:acetyltransferase-like isoleucine patch superfamily enzyme
LCYPGAYEFSVWISSVTRITPTHSPGLAESARFSDLAQIGCAGSMNGVHGEAVVETPVRIWGDLVGRVSLGAFSYTQGFTSISNADIGRFCSIAWGVVVGPGEHPVDWLSTHPFVCADIDDVIGISGSYPKYNSWLGSRSSRSRELKRVTIGSDVWIGHNALIKQGVKIGHGAIIGAGSVVTRDVEAYSIVGGSPARHIRYRFPPDIRYDLLNLEFWNYDLSPITALIDYSNVALAIDAIWRAIRNGSVQSLKPPKFRLADGWATPI